MMHGKRCFIRWGCGQQRRGKEAIKLDVRVADRPKCGSLARPARNTAYCPMCGWNRLAAAEDICQSLLVLPLVFLAFFVFSLLTSRWLGILVISGLSCLWTVGSGLKLFLPRGELRRTGLTSPIAGSATVAQVERARDDGCVAPSRFSHCSTLAVPRKLKMKYVFRWLGDSAICHWACLHGRLFLLIRHRVTPIRAYDWSSSLLRFTVRLHQRLQQSRCLRCSDCYRVERTSFRAGIPQLWTSAFSRRTRLPRLTLLKFSCDQLLPRLMGRRRARRTRRHSAGTSTLI
jgi:hypothetical protein